MEVRIHLLITLIDNIGLMLLVDHWCIIFGNFLPLCNILHDTSGAGESFDPQQQIDGLCMLEW